MSGPEMLRPTVGGLPERVQPFASALQVRSRRGRVIVVAAAAVAMGATILVAGTVGPDRMIGLPGVIGMLVGLTVAVLCGARIGAAVAALGGFAFVAVVTEQARPEPVWFGVPVVAIWSGVAFAAGVAADALRRRASDALDFATAEMRERATLQDQILAGLVPTKYLTTTELRIITVSHPGERRLVFGGDFVDMVSCDDGTVGVVVGDVSGHGPGAAALGARLRVAWRSLALTITDRDAIFRSLARIAFEECSAEDRFATVCACYFDPSDHTIDAFLAGHPPPITRGVSWTAPLSPAPPLGIAPDATVSAVRGRTGERFSVLVHTDGIIEGRATPASSSRWGSEGLRAALESEPEWKEAALIGVVAAAERANGGPLEDDVTLLVAGDPTSVSLP